MTEDNDIYNTKLLHWEQTMLEGIKGVRRQYSVIDCYTHGENITVAGALFVSATMAPSHYLQE